MNEKQAIYALDNQIRQQRQQIAALARTIALLADAMTQHLDGRIDKRTAAGNFRNLHASAAQVLRQAS